MSTVVKLPDFSRRKAWFLAQRLAGHAGRTPKAFKTNVELAVRCFRHDRMKEGATCIEAHDATEQFCRDTDDRLEQIQALQGTEPRDNVIDIKRQMQKAQRENRWGAAAWARRTNREQSGE